MPVRECMWLCALICIILYFFRGLSVRHESWARVLFFNDILHMSFLAGTHVFKAYPAYTTTEIQVRTKCSLICSVSVELYL